MVHPRRAVALLGTATITLALPAVACLLVTWALDGPGPTAVTPAVLDIALARVAALAAGAVLAWWSLAVLTCLVSALHRPGRPTAVAHAAARTLPRPLRSLVATAIGVVIAAGTATPAFAAATASSLAAAEVAVVNPAWTSPDGGEGRVAPDTAGAPDLLDTWGGGPDADAPPPVSPGWAPPRPSQVRQAAPATLVVDQPRPATSVADEVVVRRGDTLWDICARHLPGDATDAEIAAEWPRWYQANRDVIGPDPDRIQPGQRLRPPSTTDAGATAAEAGRAG